MKTILITGASGFLGRHCIPLLPGNNYEVHGTYYHNKQSFPNIHWHKTNLLNDGEPTKIIETLKPDILLHLAWYTNHGLFWSADENFEWLRSSMELLQAFHKNGGHTAIFSGTCAEYDWQYGICREFITPCNPTTVYGACKNALRQVVESYCQSHNIHYGWGRVFFLFGPHENSKKLIPSLINALLNNQKPSCHYGDIIRDFMFVKDVAKAFVTMIESPPNMVVNISSGIPVKLNEIVQLIAVLMNKNNLLDSKLEMDHSYYPQILIGDNTLYKEKVVDIRLTSISEALKQTISYWVDQKNILKE